MKKNIFFILIIFSLPVIAQRNTGSVKLGHFSPDATDGGFIIGFEGGRFLDRHFNIGWSVDWFHKNYVDKRLVQDFNELYGIGSGELNELRAKTILHDFPLMLTATAYYPVMPRMEIFITGGLGAELLLIYYRNFQNPDNDELKGAFDFNWRIGAGAAFQLGSLSDLIAEVTYHSSEPGWEYEVDNPLGGPPKIYERIFDMSGLMVRVGFRFYY
jgi:hypothetical protein